MESDVGIVFRLNCSTQKNANHEKNSATKTTMPPSSFRFVFPFP